MITNGANCYCKRMGDIWATNKASTGTKAALKIILNFKSKKKYLSLYHFIK